MARAVAPRGTPTTGDATTDRALRLGARGAVRTGLVCYVVATYYGPRCTYSKPPRWQAAYTIAPAGDAVEVTFHDGRMTPAAVR